MSAESKLTGILEHHHTHRNHDGGVADSLNIYVDDEVVLQFSSGVIQPLYSTDSEERDEARQYLEGVDGLSEEEDIGWWVPGGDADWTVDYAYDLIADLLEIGGFEIEDISFVKEINCPDGGEPNWEDLDADVSTPPGKSYELAEMGRDGAEADSSQSKSIRLHEETWEKLGDESNEFGPRNPSNLPVVEYRFELDGVRDCHYAYHSGAHFLRSLSGETLPAFERLFERLGVDSDTSYEAFDQWDAYLETVTLNVDQQIGLTHLLITEGYGVSWDGVEVVNVCDTWDHPRDMVFDS